MDIDKQSEEKQKAKKYTNTKQLMGISDFVLQIAFLQFILVSGFSKYLATNIILLIPNTYLAMLVFVIVIAIIGGIFMFPVELYSGFILEHRYNLSNQSFLRWLLEEMKGLLVSFAIFLPVMLAIYYFIRRFGTLWWLPIACFMFVLSVILSLIFPVLIMPLFYKFTPIEDEDLKQRLTKLAEKSGISVKGVYSFNMSKNSRKANAGLAGIGGTKRIILADNLISEFTIEEIEAIFAHELAHQKYHHILKSILFSPISNFIGFFLVAEAYRRLIGLYGFHILDEISAIPLIISLLGLFVLCVTPFGNILSRYYERQSDRYAIASVGKEPFISAMHRLASMNLSDEEPNPIVEFLLYSHPSISNRIKMAKNTSN